MFALVLIALFASARPAGSHPCKHIIHVCNSLSHGNVTRRAQCIFSALHGEVVPDLNGISPEEIENCQILRETRRGKYPAFREDL